MQNNNNYFETIQNHLEDKLYVYFDNDQIQEKDNLYFLNEVCESYLYFLDFNYRLEDNQKEKYLDLFTDIFEYESSPSSKLGFIHKILNKVDDKILMKTSSLKFIFSSLMDYQLRFHRCLIINEHQKDSDNFTDYITANKILVLDLSLMIANILMSLGREERFKLFKYIHENYLKLSMLPAKTVFTFSSGITQEVNHAS